MGTFPVTPVEGSVYGPCGSTWSFKPVDVALKAVETFKIVPTLKDVVSVRGPDLEQ